MRPPPPPGAEKKRRGEIEMEGAPTLRNEKHVAVPLDFSAHLHTSSQGRIIRAVNASQNTTPCSPVAPAGRPYRTHVRRVLAPVCGGVAAPAVRYSLVRRPPDLSPISARMPPAPDLVTARSPPDLSSHAPSPRSRHCPHFESELPSPQLRHPHVMGCLITSGMRLIESA